MITAQGQFKKWRKLVLGEFEVLIPYTAYFDIVLYALQIGNLYSTEFWGYGAAKNEKIVFVVESVTQTHDVIWATPTNLRTYCNSILN